MSCINQRVHFITRKELVNGKFVQERVMPQPPPLSRMGEGAGGEGYARSNG